MAVSQLSYFTCTLCEAQDYNKSLGAYVEHTENGTIISHDFYEDVTGFVNYLASKHSDRLAIGCVKPASKEARKEWDGFQEEILTFEDVRRLSTQIGYHLEEQLRSTDSQSEWVALFATSSPIFLLVWLALLRVGFKVLLIAPQSSSQTIQHLIRLSGASTVLHDERYQKAVEAALAYEDDSTFEQPSHEDDLISKVRSFLLPWSAVDQVDSDTQSQSINNHDSRAAAGRKATDVVYSFHSSGTTGLPKLIPQTNHGAVGILPLLQQAYDGDKCSKGTFSTTPLYSGGIADVFRSWSAAAPLWLFCEGSIPITSTNILASINGANSICRRLNIFSATKVCYLSCVPFVLESMMEHEDSLRILQEMEMVGVGGAAMPKHLGDSLIEKGVPLVSRFGSSENGFLLSSARDFHFDKEWDTLRWCGNDQLEFQKLDDHDDRFELLVPVTWPMVSTATHAKRPFNTHDVFIPHAKVRSGWSYKGRSDAQLTLKTGRKFDPTETEAVLKESRYIEDAVVVGEGQVAPAVLIFPSRQGAEFDEQKLINIVEAILSHVNQQVSKYARLDRQYVKLLTSGDTSRIPKNNKGGVVRTPFQVEFTAEIAALYGEGETSKNGTTNAAFTSYDSILEFVKAVITDQLKLNYDFTVNDDLFEAGLDSQGCMSICRQLKTCMNVDHLGLSAIYECGTTRNLSQHISGLLGISAEIPRNNERALIKTEQMTLMVEENLSLQPKLLDCMKSNGLRFSSFINDPSKKTFLLSGATGFLGAYILGQLLLDVSVTKIFLFIRGSRTAAYVDQLKTARSRVEAAMSYRRLDDVQSKTAFESKVTFVPVFMKDDDLGIPESIRNEIIHSITHVIHAAWEVNFNLSLKAFAAHVKGSVSLYNLALLAGLHGRRDVSFSFCSSVASIQNRTYDNSSNLRNEISHDPSDAATLGYGQSKWVTERVLDALNQRNEYVKLSILRVGQLSGDTRHGIWSHREAWPLMFDASLHIIPLEKDDSPHQSRPQSRCVLPDIASTKSEFVDWLPVDIAAQDVVGTTIMASRSAPRSTIRPVLNSEKQVNWAMVQQYVSHWAARTGRSFTLLPAQEWLDRLDASKQDHQAKALLPLWRKNWKPRDEPAIQDCPGRDSIDRDRSMDDSTGDAGSELDKDYFERILSWIAQGQSS